MRLALQPCVGTDCFLTVRLASHSLKNVHQSPFSPNSLWCHSPGQPLWIGRTPAVQLHNTDYEWAGPRRDVCSSILDLCYCQ